MIKGLIIVESPTKARTLDKFLGKEYLIKASMGHIRDLPKREIGIDIGNGFKPKYIIDRSKSKVIKQLKDSALLSKDIYLASDHDREGEAIAWHLQHVLKDVTKDKNVYRIVFNEITKKAVTEALEQPGKIDIKKVDSQQARRLLDRLVGYTVSPLLWKVISGGLSAGRVQSVALRIICEREEEIQSFEKKEYWSIEADFFRDNLPPFHAVLHRWDNKKIELNNAEEAEDLLSKLKDSSYHISEKKVSTRKVQPLPPFITSTLQQEASKIFGFSSRKTMMIAQKLYEGVSIGGESTALISYMRTDSLRLSQEALDGIRREIVNVYGEKKLNSSVRAFKNKNKAQDAHEAIRPTDMSLTPDSLKSHINADQYKLYSLIWLRAIATQMKPAIVETTNVEVSGGDAMFKVSGGTIIDNGFLEAYTYYNVSLGENIDKNYAAKDNLTHKDMKGVQHFTKPPARFTEALLIKELESNGIGRPSTYASITTTILDREYVQIEDKRFLPTELGKTVNHFLVEKFGDVFNIEFTRKLEDGLDSIAEGKTEWVSLLDNYYSRVEELINSVDVKEAKKEITEDTDIKCDKCGAPMIIKWGRRGRFLGCSAYPKCSNIKSISSDQAGNIKVDVPQSTGEKCPLDGGDLVIKTSRYGRFVGCSNYPACKYTQQVTLGVKCPACKEGDMTEKRDKRKRVFYSCSTYPKCKYATYNKPVDMKCPSCDNYYLEEVKGNDEIKYRCPSCKKEFA